MNISTNTVYPSVQIDYSLHLKELLEHTSNDHIIQTHIILSNPLSNYYFMKF